MEQYGPLAQLVAISGNLGAAVFAVYTTWAGRTFWEPRVENLEKAPRRITGAMCIVGIAILFFGARKSFGFTTFVYLSSGLAIAALTFFLMDLFLRKITIFKCDDQDLGIIGGFWITPAAKKVLAGESSHLLPSQAPPAGLQDFYCNSGRQPDRIWSRASQALALTTITAIYCFWTGAATLAVSTAALLVERAIN